MRNRLLTSLCAMTLVAASSATAVQAADSGWTNYFSEEVLSWTLCEAHERVGATHCTGSYCDNISLYCKDTLPLHTGTDHVAYFSDESGAADCNAVTPDREITGMSCSGQYCDNMRIRCSQYESGTAANCSWTAWVSEEGAGLNSFMTKHARAAQCSGSYCDAMRYLICDVG
jgi:hypothetical protein